MAGAQDNTQIETRGARRGESIRTILFENDSRPLRVFSKEMIKDFHFRRITPALLWRQGDQVVSMADAWKSKTSILVIKV